MIDTVRVQISLTQSQFLAVLRAAKDSDREQWAKVCMKTGDLRLLRVDGLAVTDQNSFHRDIRWDVSPTYAPDKTFLTVELSLPKLFYGDNVRLLYDSLAALELLRKLLNRAFRFRTRGQLPEPKTWGISRADLCYTWRFPDQEHAKHFMKSLQQQRFPYKQPNIYPTSIHFQGGKSSTYSAKFYLKLPEFQKHDGKAMAKAKVAESEIRFREQLAAGILRFEITLRHKWLSRHEIKTVSDLISPINRMVFDEDLVAASMPFFNPKVTASCIMSCVSQDYDKAPSIEQTAEGEMLLKNGDYFSLPAGEYSYGRLIYKHPGGGFTMQIVENPVENILQEMLEKMVGKDAQLNLPTRVNQKLSAVYKPSTAANLTAFWLFVQNFGTDKALENYGKTAFYYKKRQLKKAGLSLLGNQGNTIVLGKDFFTNFALTIPSDSVGNKVDDYRDSRNVLNLNEYLDKKVN